MILIILGPDSGLAHNTLKRALRDRDPSGQSTSWLDGNTVGIRSVINDIASLGFFSSGRVVVVEGLIARLGKQGARDGGSAPDWERLYQSVPENNALILLDPSLSELPSLAKKPLPKSASVRLSRPPRGAELVEWIVTTARSQDATIDKATAQHLAMTLFPSGWATEPRNPIYDRPPDMEMLGNEINKLALAAYPESITRAVVDSMTSREERDEIFLFLDAAAGGDVLVAMRELDKLLISGEDPAKLLAQLLGNLEIASVVSAGGRRPPVEIGKDIAISSASRIGATQKGLQGMSPRVAQERIPIARGSDLKLKTGEVKEPIDALYDAILGIANMRRSASHMH